MLNLGINSESIAFEVALEALGQSLQPFIAAIDAENVKGSPSPEFIRYCEMRISALTDLQDELRPEDKSTIERILDKDSQLFRR